MDTKRGGGLWIAGRIGILICFGILPLMRICSRSERRALKSTLDDWAYLHYTFKKFDAAIKTNVGEAAKWQNKGAVELQRVIAERAKE